MLRSLIRARHSPTLNLKLMSAPPQPVSALAQSKIKRSGPQLLADQLVADELAATAGQAKGRLLTDEKDPWAHNAW